MSRIGPRPSALQTCQCILCMSYLHAYIFIHSLRPKLKHFIIYIYINTIHHTSFIKYKTYCVTIENFHNIITMKISGFQGNPAPRLDFASSCSNTDRGLRDNKSWMAVFNGERHGETMGNHGKPLFNILKLPCHQGHLACTTFSGIALRKLAPKALGRTAASWTIMSSWRKF